ncbi:MAG: 30S ribosomal protein S4 [Thermodesulfobacteriota bacterium]|nr:MAG: 30S ribosomal protein S4 [Thermodesulfobacteriota bacterium]
MARYRGAVCKLCRREDQKLFLKGDRCFSDKCGFERRNYPPGQHGQRRGKFSDYGNQLREKQKVKRMYGLLERQFRKCFRTAERKSGITGENFLILLERRLDNIVFRLGFAYSRNQGRQLVSHNHVLVNGKRVNIPSYIVKAGDVVEISEKSQKMPLIKEAVEAVERLGVPSWLELDKENYRGKVIAFPERKDLTMPVQEQLIVELYSR